MEVRFKKNDLIELRIDDLGSEGEGIGKFEGFTLFVKGAIPGDLIQARILKVKKGYGFAKIEKILIASDWRIAAVCELAGRCGGCQLQHLEYLQQIEFKEKKIRDCLERLGGIVNPPIEGMIKMENPYYYRNKAQFPVGIGNDRTVSVGFYAGHSHTIIDMEHCYIQEPVNELLMKCIRSFLNEFRISIYNEQNHTGLVRHILTRIGYATGDIMVCFVLNGANLPRHEELVDRLTTAIESVETQTQLMRLNVVEGERPKYHLKGLCVNVNKDKTNVILGTKVEVLYGDTFIVDYIGDVKYQISPLSFFQVNPIQTIRLYETILSFADLHGTEIVWDLYCGIGTISLFLAKNAKRIYGVEIVPQAVEDAMLNARMNGIDNAEFLLGAAEVVLPDLYSKDSSLKADLIVIDPPRKGCDGKLLDVISALLPEKVIYVSCDPATLARDLKCLCEVGYILKRVKGVDMFAWTVHVESVVLMSRVDK